jgi:radical SAM superfamily enzyme YgiQ (UPF0313 family)
MKVYISYPPIENTKGVPLLSQNRQFQWFSEPTYIYPVVPAYAASLLKEAGYDVVWDDAIAEEKIYGEWLSSIGKSQPDIMLIETKTPVVKTHWKIIEDVKEVSPETKIAFVGDHVTAMPRESMENSKADYILTGGDYDFLLLNLVEYLSGKTNVLEPGIWFRKDGEIKSSGDFLLNHDLNLLPFIDRDLTKWRLYAYKNGNYKVTPGTYTMVGRDCWWRKNGGCSFCAWTTLYPNFRTRKPELLIEEIESLVEKYRIKEIFDDTGTFPVGGWLKEFCNLMIERKLNEKIHFGVNMRFGALSFDEYKLMKKAGFRMLLFGLESASQETLNRINKGIDVNDIVEGCRNAKMAGLEPHLTIMVGYPWETREDAWNSFKLAKSLFEKGWADTLQVTIVIPYPGTILFQEAKELGFLKTLDWNEYDMKKPVLTSSLPDEDVEEMAKKIYGLFLAPKYVARRIVTLRSAEDLEFLLRGAKKVLGHIKDFSR